MDKTYYIISVTLNGWISILKKIQHPWRTRRRRKITSWTVFINYYLWLLLILVLVTINFYSNSWWCALTRISLVSPQFWMFAPSNKLFSISIFCDDTSSWWMEKHLNLMCQNQFKKSLTPDTQPSRPRETSTPLFNKMRLSYPPRYRCVRRYMLRAGPAVLPVTWGASPTFKNPSPWRRPTVIDVHLFTSISCSERIITGLRPVRKAIISVCYLLKYYALSSNHF